ncbi:hypothetical protein SteCoe_8607 [Stentor coeruleus]|uniref:Histone deacetylase n=1 Tax=Stentor coeruleus TaxID=5963 RepID=A0A1R2CJW7_9CILI|nr:hypothetical protein SteCoe_8607 [Stentor coeruleus]
MKVLYYYDDDVGNYFYGAGHPMKPHRIRMTHALLDSYKILDHLEVVDSNVPTLNIEDHLIKYHTEDYIDFLKTVTPDNLNDYLDLFVGFNMGEDCPVFEGLWDYCKISTTGSVLGATAICEGRNKIAINWAGGLHHAKEQEASGFCYTNDCVMGILELLKFYQRVLYVDIDIHHGDGVEEAFYTSNRVLTCSFHKFGNYFPDTGYFSDIGYGAGNGYSVNFPLSEGMDDESYETIFKPLITSIMETYRPEAVVMQCGGDSLSGDRLGCFNLSTRGHGECVKFVKSFNIPMLVLGGGGYTIRNVSRCWAYETSVLCGLEVDTKIPEWDDYIGYYAPEYTLFPSISNMENQNTKEYLRTSLETLITQLREKVIPVSTDISNYKEINLYNTPNRLYSTDNIRAFREEQEDMKE